MQQAIVLLALLALGAMLAQYHVANQSYFPVAMLASADGYTVHMVQDRTAQRDACGKANDIASSRRSSRPARIATWCTRAASASCTAWNSRC